MLNALGTILSTTPYPTAVHYSIRLHRPVPVYEPATAPDCCFITKSLHPCDRWDYCRLESSVVLGSLHPIPIRFVDRPVAWWIGRGKLAKKAVEVVDVMVYGERYLELFVKLARVGFSYWGATKKRRRKKK